MKWAAKPTYFMLQAHSIYGFEGSENRSFKAALAATLVIIRGLCTICDMGSYNIQMSKLLDV